MGSGEIDAVNDALLGWFDIHRRTLPFRAARTPYRVWVSEVMLQQTQAGTAGPRFEAFLRRFPDPAALAAASEQEVLLAWQGLGYYARARNLHRAARLIVERHGGRVPGDPAALRALPGIGPYIAAAVGAFAFGRDEAACDANVLRVLARLFDRPRADAALAAAVLARGRAADWNEALMDLGATICLPRRPDCGACPLQAHCAGWRAGRAADLPVRSPRPARPVVLMCTLALRDGRGCWAVVPRPARGLLAGMWECPSLVGTDDAGEAARCHGVLLEEAEPLAAFRHVFTHREWDVRPFRARGSGGGVRWVTDAELAGLPLAGPTVRLLAQVAGAPALPAK